ncbi:GGDEF domain-containing protein [Dethiosulfovibrio sp. F2B]|nr:GGDEF domain-containing protein [Dethiosulfovibrio faecalis]
MKVKRRSLKRDVLVIVMISFGFLSLMYGVMLKQVVDDYQTARANERGRIFDTATDRLQATLDNLVILSTNLSLPKDVSKAVTSMNNEFLSDWGKAFCKTVSSVFFIDIDGVVIARAPDEYRFGDSVSSEPFFDEVLKKGSYSGITTVDGRDSFLSCSPIRKYDDLVVGFVAVSQTITPSLLESLLPVGHMTLTFQGRRGFSERRRELSPSGRYRSIIVDDGVFDLYFLSDDSERELLKLQRNLIITFTIVTISTMSSLIFFLRRRFEPYSKLVQGLVDYSDKRIDLDGLLDVTSGAVSNGVEEIRHIAEALTDMIKVLKNRVDDIQSYSGQLENLANCDSLTGLWNRRKMDQVLMAETENARVNGTPLSVVMLDVDYFKEVNDTYGHEMGDAVLNYISTLMKGCLRKCDSAGRWGGEEFLVVLPGLDSQRAWEYADKMRSTMENHTFRDGMKITSSFGVTLYRPGEPINEFVARADDALYDAKRKGRDRVEAR